MSIERKPVKSSQLSSIGYDPEKLVLEVEFSTGAVYQYFQVKPEHHQALLAADSIGSHFGQNIRGKFSYSKP